MELQTTSKPQNYNFRVENYTSSNITVSLIEKIADFYRFIFNNNGNYLVFPSTLEFLSPAEIFQKSDSEIVDLGMMDSLTEFPIHPQTGERAVFWHDPATTFAKIRNKLKQESYLTIFRNLATESIEGLCFGTIASIGQHFEAEGWHNPLYYANREIPAHKRDLNNLLHKLQAKMQDNSAYFSHYKVSADAKVYCWNCMTTSPQIRGIDNLLALTSEYFAHIPESIKSQLPVISEVRFKSTSHSLLKIAGYLDVPKTLTEKSTIKTNTDSLIIVAPLSVVAQNFSLPPRKFRQLARQRKKEQLSNNAIVLA